MGSKGGGHTTSTVTQQSIPEEFYPYFENMLIRGEEASLQPYIPYSGQRLSDQNVDTLASQQMVRDLSMQGSPTLDMATGLTAQGALGSQAFAGMPGYEFSQYQFDPTQNFSGDAVSQYMNPYMQNVVDMQKMQAASDYMAAQGQRGAQAVSAGAFGGSRQAVQSAIAERDLLNRTNQIQAEGLSNAYTDAQRMFAEDRAARFGREQAQAGELGRVQAGQSGENLARDQFGLGALAQSGSMAEQLAALGQMGRTQDIQNAQLLETMARSNEARQQAELDMAYQDFINQREYPMERLQQLSAMLHGLPIQPAGTTTTQTPYNPTAQALGMGISALGLYNAMG
jgi:hypothetical protein